MMAKLEGKTVAQEKPYRRRGVNSGLQGVAMLL
jgi:hypothetical protein